MKSFLRIIGILLIIAGLCCCGLSCVLEEDSKGVEYQTYAVVDGEMIPAWGGGGTIGENSEEAEDAETTNVLGIIMIVAGAVACLASIFVSSDGYGRSYDY